MLAMMSLYLLYNFLSGLEKVMILKKKIEKIRFF